MLSPGGAGEEEEEGWYPENSESLMSGGRVPSTPGIPLLLRARLAEDSQKMGFPEVSRFPGVVGALGGGW